MGYTGTIGVSSGTATARLQISRQSPESNVCPGLTYTCAVGFRGIDVPQLCQQDV